MDKAEGSNPPGWELAAFPWSARVSIPSPHTPILGWKSKSVQWSEGAGFQAEKFSGNKEGGPHVRSEQKHITKTRL